MRIHIDVNLPKNRDPEFEAEIKELNNLIIKVAKACCTVSCVDNLLIDDMNNPSLPKEYIEYATDMMQTEPDEESLPTFAFYVFNEVFNLRKPNFRELATSCIYNPAHMSYYADLVLEHCNSCLSEQEFNATAAKYVEAMCQYL